MAFNTAPPPVKVVLGAVHGRQIQAGTQVFELLEGVAAAVELGRVPILVNGVVQLGRALGKMGGEPHDRVHEQGLGGLDHVHDLLAFERLGRYVHEIAVLLAPLKILHRSWRPFRVSDSTT